MRVKILAKGIIVICLVMVMGQRSISSEGQGFKDHGKTGKRSISSEGQGFKGHRKTGKRSRSSEGQRFKGHGKTGTFDGFPTRNCQ